MQTLRIIAYSIAAALGVLWFVVPSALALNSWLTAKRYEMHSRAMRAERDRNALHRAQKRGEL